MRWSERAAEALAAIDHDDQRRSLRSFNTFGPTGVLDGRTVVSYASNDYLGLSAHPSVVAAAIDATRRWGTGSTASRLVVGTRPVHEDFERDYARSVSAAAALVVSSGYAANLSVLTTFGGPETTVLSDELNHASIIDGCRLAKARSVVYRHNDVDHLAASLAEVSGPSIVVTDAVFSMDGDAAPLDEIAHCCLDHESLLVIDGAHAVLGPRAPVLDGLDVVQVGTLSKTLGSLGGVIAGSTEIIDLLVNRARPFIFSTGLTPADTAAAHAALRLLDEDEGRALVDRLAEIVQRVCPGNPSPIVPVVIGAERDAVAASAALLERGILVPAIRPPTVAPGTSRLRIALSAAHTDEMIDDLLDALASCGLQP